MDDLPPPILYKSQMYHLLSTGQGMKNGSQT